MITTILNFIKIEVINKYLFELQAAASGSLQSPIDNYEDRHRKKDKWTSDTAKVRHVSVKPKTFYFLTYNVLIID